MQRWIERSEARWALWAGVAGALAMAALATMMILSHRQPGRCARFHLRAAGRGRGRGAGGHLGAALGHVVEHLRGRAAEPRIVFVALVAAPSCRRPSATRSGRATRWKTRCAKCEPWTVRRSSAPSPSRPGGATSTSARWRSISAAGPALLEGIGALEDPALEEPMVARDVMGENRAGESRKAPLARHPNAGESARRCAPR